MAMRNNDGKDEEDMNGDENGTRKGKCTNNGKENGSGKAMEERKAK
jgi:hypothetical protein